jgi:hypothetical protein
MQSTSKGTKRCITDVSGNPTTTNTAEEVPEPPPQKKQNVENELVRRLMDGVLSMEAVLDMLNHSDPVLAEWLKNIAPGSAEVEVETSIEEAAEDTLSGFIVALNVRREKAEEDAAELANRGTACPCCNTDWEKVEAHLTDHTGAFTSICESCMCGCGSRRRYECAPCC